MRAIQRMFSLVLVLALLAGTVLPAGAAENSSPLVISDGRFSYRSAFLKAENLNGEEQTVSAPFFYDERWFREDSTRYDHDLATMSLCMAMAAASTAPDSIAELFGALAFTDTTLSYPEPTGETIGYAIGSKALSGTAGEAVTLVAVAVRGGGYQEEWADNFRVGTGAEHEGFRNSANKVVQGIRDHIAAYGLSGDIRLWITGYSRAAAVANLTAHSLNVAARAGELPGLSETGIYAYCFEGPAGATRAAVAAAPVDSNIYNIGNQQDIVPMFAPAYWDFTSYGITYSYPSPATCYREWPALLEAMRREYSGLLVHAGVSPGEAAQTAVSLTTTVPAQNLILQQTVDVIATSFRNQETYTREHQAEVMTALADCFGGGGDISQIYSLLSQTMPFLLYQHRALANTIIMNVYNVVQPHYPELCLAWMRSLEGEQLQREARTRYITVNGDAGIALYDSTGTLAARIAGGKVQSVSGGSIEGFVDENGQQILAVPFGEDFTVEITANAAGSLSWQVEEYDFLTSRSLRVTGYDDIPVNPGDVLRGTLGSGGSYSCAAPGGELAPARDASGEAVRHYAVTVSSQGQGNITGGGYFTEGEYARITAQPYKGGTFYGWYADGTLLSTQADYRFRVEQDLDITAWFEKYREPEKPTEPEPTVPTEPEPSEPEVATTRLAGGNRFETASMVADRMKENLGIEKFDAVVVASGTEFADALAGSYLAAVKNAPVLLTYSTDAINSDVKAYIRENLTPGGTVYILGGAKAVPENFGDGLEEQFTVKRLAGENRFATNLLVLEEAGVGDKPILVCTGLDFADSLSASAAKLPILLVYGDKLLPEQAAFLEENQGSNLYIIGGEGAVSKDLETVLTTYGNIERVAGGNRFETSTLIAEKFFIAPKSAVLAYAWDFPDGLCGGPLAATMNAPLILTMEHYETKAAEYIQSRSILNGTILGGEKLIPESSVSSIFPDREPGENELPIA